MNRIKTKIFSYASLFTFITCLPISAQAQQEVASSPKEALRLVADAWCPYNCEINSDAQGYIIDIARAIFEPLGHLVEYQNVPWSRAVRQTMAGEYDGAVGATKDEMKGAIFHEQPIGYSGNYFVAHANSNWSYNGLASLEDVHIAAIQDYDYGDNISEYLTKNRKAYNVSIMTGDNITQRNLKLLAAGRIDVYLEDKNVALYAAKKQGALNDIKFVGKSNSIQALYIAFSPNNPNSQQYAKTLSKGVASLRSSGQLSEILARYGLTDWQK